MHDCKKLISIVALAIALISGLWNSSSYALSGDEQAAVRETREELKTYPFSDPDPVPIFARSGLWGKGSRLYPYSFFSGFSDQAERRPWSVVRLENPYISVAVLPEVGGKVWGATDKTSGREYLYTNKVMKFREIALRGPWTSGGIEFNFGIVGHSPNTATPVDYKIHQDPDGGVSVTVGALDLVSRTRWSVTVRAPKDKVYFETNGNWYNPTPFNQSYYFWSCGAIRTAEDLRYIFPGRWQIGHDYDVPLKPWPIDDQGRDISLYRLNDTDGSKSYFTVGEKEDFYGAWYEKSNTGFGHWALYDDMPGRKVWIWDQSRSGEIWVDLLTDGDGQYTEPQAGRLLNQSDHEFLSPGVTDRWQEIWFPYEGIGPMMASSPAGVLNVETKPESVSVSLYPLQALEEDLVVISEGKEVYREHLKPAPAKAWKKVLPWKPAGKAFTVQWGESLVWQSDPAKNDVDRPYRFRDIPETTAEGIFLSGMRLEKGRNFEQALEKYRACLEKEPGHVRALVRMAEIHTRRGEYAKASGLAAKALEEDMYDPAANYTYGTIARRMGKWNDAKETLGWAARSMEYRSSAYQQLAEIALLQKNFTLALKYAGQATDYNHYNSGALEIQALAYRRMGKKDAAVKILKQLSDQDPLDHAARFEAWRLEPTETKRKEFQDMIRHEFPHESYLEMALFYIRVGAVEDAVELLKLSPEYPTVAYWLAFLTADRAPAESKRYLETAGRLSPRLVFPHREEEIPLLEWARSVRPDDWRPNYYLGLLLWGKGRMEEAKALLGRCDRSDYAPLFVTRAMLYRQSDPQRAQADYEKAWKLDGKSWRNWHTLIDFQIAQKRFDQALNLAKEASPLFPGQTPIQVDLVKALLNSGQPAEAAAVLDRMKALPYEGAADIHRLFVQTHLQVGLQSMRATDWAAAIRAIERSKEYPESLGTGKPYHPDYRPQDYLLGWIYEKQGLREKAEAAYRAVLAYTDRAPARRSAGAGAWFGARALQRAGRKAEADELLKNAVQPSPEILEIVNR